MASYTSRGLRRKRARLAAGAVVVSASLLSMYAAALRALPTYAATGKIAPRTAGCLAGSTEVANDSELQAAVVSSVDDSIICLTESITLSSTLELDDTSLTLMGRDDSAVTLTAPSLGGRHIYADFTNLAKQSELTIESLTLTDGYMSGPGGSVFVHGNFNDQLNVQNATFAHNAAVGNGGAIYTKSAAEMDVQATSVHMYDNMAAQGGAIAMRADSSAASLLIIGTVTEPSLFADDTALTGDGGAVYVSSDDTALALVFGQVTFSGSHAVGGDGGAIATHSDHVQPGGYYIFSSSTWILGSDEPISPDPPFVGSYGIPSFVGNSASARGGAIHSNGAVITSPFFAGDLSGITGGVFAYNSADFGGAISAPYVLAFLDRFAGNEATTGGGAIAVDDTSIAGVIGSSFQGNSTAGSGGALFSAGAPSSISLVSYSTFSDNEANGNGGAIYLGGPNSALRNVTLTDDSAGGSGGGAYLGGGATLEFVTAVNERAGGEGGAIASDDQLTVSDSIFWGNAATVDDSDVSAPPTWTTAFSLFSDDSSFSPPATAHNSIIGEDPLLGPLADNGGLKAGDLTLLTMMLDPSSPARGTANPDSSGFPDYDARGPGFARFFASGTDRGATQTQFGVNSVSPSSGTVRGGTSVDIYGSGFTGADAVSFGALPAASFVIDDTTHIVAVTPPSAAGVVDVTVGSGPHEVTLPSAFRFRAPTPQPTPPGSPTDVVATAGDASAVVSWKAPSSSGSSPVSGYRVVGTPSGACETTQLTCSVTGLDNGTPYTFRVEARNSAGYGTASAPSDSVTPTATPVEKSIVIIGSRDASAARPQVLVEGATTGLVGQTVVPHLRFPGEAMYSTGVARPTVSAEGAFTWTRRTSKKMYVYFTSGAVVSNRVIIPARSQVREVPGAFALGWPDPVSPSWGLGQHLRDWLPRLLGRG